MMCCRQWRKSILARHLGPAGADVKFLADERERFAQRTRMREWPEVARAVVLLHARELEARERIVQVHLHEQELFVIAKADVVARPVFLDQLALEQQRLRLALDRVRLEVPDAVEQRERLAIVMMPPTRMKILADALEQIARLADIDDAVEPILEQVHARLVRQLAHLRHDIGTFSNHPFIMA